MSYNLTSSWLILMLRRRFFVSKSNNKNTKMRQQRCCSSRRTKLSPVYLILICCVVTCLLFIASNFFFFINDEKTSSIIESINPQNFKNVPTTKITTTKFHTIHLPSHPPTPTKNNNFANVTITSRIYRPLKENAIVFMVQKTHSTYENRDSYGMLLHCLDLLYQNYLSLNLNATTSSGLDNTDIYLFHTGDYHPSDLDIIEPHVMPPITEQQDQGHHKGIIKLVNLKDTKYWNLPANLRNDNPTEDWIDYSLFPIGYRHMCRFFAIKIWDLFQTINKQQQQQQQQETNYQYIWRLDEDSLILSPINYDVFDYMKTHQYKYGYRMCSYELSQHKFGTHTWFVKKHKAIQPRRTIDYNLCGFYNNFFIANLQFMLSKKVQSLLNEIDKRGFIYRRRYGDLIIHSLIVYAFATPQKIHRFLDFTYQHVTIDKRVNKDGCLLWGGIQAGYLDPHPTKSMLNFQKQHNLIIIGNDDDSKNSTQSYCVANKTKLLYEDLSPTYSHLSEEMKKSISLQTITAGKVELVGKGILSG